MNKSALRGPGEVAEDQAGPELARTYARLREMLGVEFVPTVHRMLGMHEEYLTAATESVGDLMAGSSGDEFAARARDMAHQAALSFPEVSISAGGDAEAINAMLDRYNRANPLNLLFTRAMLPEGPADGGKVMGSRLDQPIDFADPEAVLADVEAAHGGFVKPGLWRELAEFPGVLTDSWLAVRALAGLPAFQEARSGLLEAASKAAADVAAPVPRDLGISDEEAASIDEILTWFTHGISSMVVEIEYLRYVINDKPGD